MFTEKLFMPKVTADAVHAGGRENSGQTFRLPGKGESQGGGELYRSTEKNAPCRGLRGSRICRIAYESLQIYREKEGKGKSRDIWLKGVTKGETKTANCAQRRGWGYRRPYKESRNRIWSRGGRKT